MASGETLELTRSADCSLAAFFGFIIQGEPLLKTNAQEGAPVREFLGRAIAGTRASDPHADDR
jgi:hypothetical protein